MCVLQILDTTFQMSAKSFFQPNPKCAERLYSKVLEYVADANVSEKSVIIDLFCGTGTITQLLAKRFSNAKVIGEIAHYYLLIWVYFIFLKLKIEHFTNHFWHK
jgi:tRNA/tmRNA/rRNA uracil-C5-methylase (TrmA/RlmC/RlmD family)